MNEKSKDIRARLLGSIFIAKPGQTATVDSESSELCEAKGTTTDNGAADQLEGVYLVNDTVPNSLPPLPTDPADRARWYQQRYSDGDAKKVPAIQNPLTLRLDWEMDSADRLTATCNDEAEGNDNNHFRAGAVWNNEETGLLYVDDDERKYEGICGSCET